MREDAYDDMLINKNYEGELTFHYNDKVFSNVNWTVEPNLDISSLYKMRAQQLRDKYKHLIVSFSGGSDSYEVLWSFLNNDIFIDEIQISCFEQMLNKLDKKTAVQDREFSYLLEYEFAVKPMLKYVAEKSPNTKITVLDASNFLQSQIGSGKFLSLGDGSNDKHVFPKLTTTVGPNHLWQYMYSVVNAKESKDKDSVCIIRGLEKPSLIMRDGQLYFSFSDQTMMTAAAINKGIMPNAYTIEDFFWSPDLPLIPVKQCHMVKRRFETDRAFFINYIKSRKEIAEFNQSNLKPIQSPAHTMERMLCEVIYPNYNPNIFAAPKHGSKSPEIKLYETVVGGNNAETFLKELRSFKETKFNKITNKQQFYRMLYTKPYHIGRIVPNYA